MAQHSEQRRLIRLAAATNSKAIRLGGSGTVTAEDLLWIETSSSTCFYCGRPLALGEGTFDHVIPLNDGGINHIINIVRACAPCNRAKFTKTPQQLADYLAFEVTCARPGCGRRYHPRFAEWQNGRARYCSRRCSALVRQMRLRGEA